MASIRVSQHPIEAAIDADPNIRVSQTVVEAAIDGDPSIRVSQNVLEAAIRNINARVTQEAVEVGLQVTEPRVTQEAVEVGLHVTEPRVTQVAVEVLLTTNVLVLPSLGPTGVLYPPALELEIPSIGPTGTLYPPSVRADQAVTLPTIASGSSLHPPTVALAASVHARITQDVRVVPVLPDTTARITEDVRVVPTTGDSSARVTEEVRVVPTTGDSSARITQDVRVVPTDGKTSARITQEVRLVVITARNETEFLPEFAGTFGPLLWIEFLDPTDDEIHVFSQVDLNDPERYYFGFKLGTIIGVDRVVRALSSDDDGSIEGQQFGVTFSDVQRYWRQIIGRDDLERIIINKQVRLRMISNPGRIAEEIPRTVALGILRGYTTA